MTGRATRNKWDAIEENTEAGEDIAFAVAQKTVPGASTYELELVARGAFRKHGVLPATRLFGSINAISLSVNGDIVFGRISKEKRLAEGDIVKIALGVFHGGFFSDLSITVPAGEPTAEGKRLIAGTGRAMQRAVETVEDGVSIGTIAKGIEDTLHQHHLRPIPDIVGHGIGRNLHEPPQIPNTMKAAFVDLDQRLETDMVVCIEPIATTGSGIAAQEGIRFWTQDGKPASHIEFPVRVRDGGCQPYATRILDDLKSHW